MEEAKKLVFIDGKWLRKPLDFRHPELDAAERRDREREKKQVIRAVQSQIPQTCGNCRSIRYSGINESIQSMGSCSRCRESGRVYVKPEGDGCELWSRRTDYKMQIELKKSAEILEKALKARKR